MNGYLALVITAHVPYLRSAGPQPEGEDLLHETIAYALVPLLNTLSDLHDMGLPVRVSLACAPLLLEQLADLVVQKHFVLWMSRWLARAEDALARATQLDDPHRRYLASFYVDWAQGILRSFIERYGRNLTNALRGLCAEGVVEPLAGAATHAYLPVLERHESLRAQIDCGTLAVTQRLGQRPLGFWLPECGYHPRLEPHLAACDTGYLILDPSSVSGDPSDGRPRWLVAPQQAVFVRDATIAQHVWSPDIGYPGDPLYRSQRRDPLSGLAYWRHGISGDNEPYDPYHAFRRAREHAEHFVALTDAALERVLGWHEQPGVVVATFDAGLLGYRWFEGITWLRALLEVAARHPTLKLTTPGTYLRAYPPYRYAAPRPGDWSQAGGLREWAGAGTLPLWHALQDVEERLAQIIRRYPHARGDQERVLAQAVREVLLAQSSDWAFLLSRRANTAEALGRPLQHLQRCDRLCSLAEQADLSEEDLRFLDEVEELDNPFPNLNYRVFSV